MNFCPNCGGRLQNPDAQSCANCGFTFQAAPAAEQPPSAAASPVPSAARNAARAPSDALRPHPQLFDYDAPFEDADESDVSANTNENRQAPQFFDLDAPFEKDAPPAATASGDVFEAEPPEAEHTLFDGARTQELPLAAGAEPHGFFDEPDMPNPPEESAAEPGFTAFDESASPTETADPAAAFDELQAGAAYPPADTAEPDALFERDPPVQRRPAAAQDGPAAGDKGFEDLLNSVNSRYSASTRRVAEPSAHMADPLAQEHIVQDTPQPGRVDQDYFPHDSAAPGAGAPLQDAQEAPSFGPVAPPQPGRADQQLFQSSSPAAGLFGMAAAAGSDMNEQEPFAPAGDAQQNLFDQPAGGRDLFSQQDAAPRQDLFADAQRAPASLDETQIFGGPPRNAPEHAQSQPRRAAAPPAPPHARQPVQQRQAPRRQAYQPETAREAARQEASPEPARPLDERARRAAMVASISNAAAENTSPIPYDTDPGAPTPRVQQRTRQAQTQRPPVRAVRQIDDYDEPAPRRSVGSIIGAVILFFLIFAIVTAIATMGLLYWRNRPAAAINDYVAALEAKDVEELAKLVTLNNTTSTVAGWEAMCAEFETEANRDELASELAKINMSATNENLKYPSIRLVGDDLFLFIKKYHVEATGVEALAPNAAEGTVLRLNGEDHPGAPADGGILYRGILPGKYNCMLFAPGAVEAPEIQQSIFSLTTPTVIGENGSSGTAAPPAAAQAGNITIENCMNDEATLYLNDMILPDKPSGGVVQLTGVPVGAVIKVTAEQDGKVYESSVTFSDPATTALRFENYTEVDVPSDDPTKFAAAVTADEINSVLANFYSSYLTCINNQNTDSMQASTDRNTQALVPRITSPDNAVNTYKFVSAACKADSVKAGEQGGLPMLTFNGTFSFNYAPRDGSAAEASASNHQSVRMIYENGQWKVDGFTIVNDNDFNNNIIAQM